MLLTRCYHRSSHISSLLRSLCQRGRIAHDDNYRISPQKHFANVPIFVDCRPSSFSLSTLGIFRPHFFDVFEQSGERGDDSKSKDIISVGLLTIQSKLNKK